MVCAFQFATFPVKLRRSGEQLKLFNWFTQLILSLWMVLKNPKLHKICRVYDTQSPVVFKAKFVREHGQMFFYFCGPSYGSACNAIVFTSRTMSKTLPHAIGQCHAWLTHIHKTNTRDVTISLQTSVKDSH